MKRQLAISITILIGVLGTPSLTFCAHAQDYNDLLKFNENKLEKLANKGNAGAAWALGDRYGRGIVHLGNLFNGYSSKDDPPDHAKEIFWHHKAADLGFSDAAKETALGEAYYFGNGGKPTSDDYDQAFFWLHRAGLLNDPSSYVFLGDCYWNGYGVQKDPKQAMIWYEKSADSDGKQKHAAYMLGVGYLNGVGVAKDVNKVNEWFKRANDPPSADVEAAVGHLFLNASYFDAAKAWLTPAAVAGNITAMHDLAMLYQDGKGVPQDSNLAAQWLQAEKEASDAAAIAHANAEAERRAQKEAFDAEMAEINARARADRMNMLNQGLSNLAQQVSTPSPIQTATNQQIANINAAAAHDAALREQQQAAARQRLAAQQAQQAAQQTAQQVKPVLGQMQNQPTTTTQASNHPPLPPNSAVLHNDVPNVNVLCPATGFVPGLMRQSGDTSVGVPCTPGSVIYINGLPQFNTCGTHYQGMRPVGTTPDTAGGPCGTNGFDVAGSGGNGSGGNGTSGQTGSSGKPDGPSENRCIQLSRNSQDYPVFYNSCSFAVQYFWTPVNPRPGEYSEQNGIIAPGETQTGVEGNGERIDVYACQTNYLVRDANGNSIDHPVTGYRCIPPM